MPECCWYYAAFAAQGIGENEIARGLIEAAAPLATTCEVLFHYAVLLHRSDRHEEALAVSERGIAMAKRTGEPIRWALQQRAESLFALGQAKEALATLDQIETRYKESKTYRLSQSMHYWRLRAVALAELKDPRATEALNKVEQVQVMWLNYRTTKSGWRH